MIFTSGGYNNQLPHGKTEVFDLTTGEWEIRADYPFDEYTYNAPSVYYEGRFILFGGFPSPFNRIDAYFPGTDQWRALGTLLSPRFAGHGVIIWDLDRTSLTSGC